MEKLELRYKAMLQALLTLQEAIEEYEISKLERLTKHKLMRDGMIQRFEYCIDGFWKFFKLYLEVNLKIVVESPSPKTILKLSLDMQLINGEECIFLLDCVSDRNLTSHSYNEEVANELEKHIPFYFITMKSIIERLG